MCVSRLSVLIARKLCIFVFLFVSCLLPFVCTSCTIFILIIIAKYHKPFLFAAAGLEAAAAAGANRSSSSSSNSPLRDDGPAAGRLPRALSGSTATMSTSDDAFDEQCQGNNESLHHVSFTVSSLNRNIMLNS